MPKVSIIVPVYNAEKSVHRCLDSILDQTYTEFELILVDDGSTDDCGAICDEYAAKDSRVLVIHKENGGVSSARNAGLDIASGEYIAFIDSDDQVSTQYLEELMQWHEYDYVTAGFTWQDSKNAWHTRIFEETNTTVADIRAYPSKYLGKYYFGSPWATLMRRTLIEDNALRFDQSVQSGEDTLFILAYLNYATTIKIAPYCGYFYYYYPSSLVNRVHEDFWLWKIKVEQSFVELFCYAEGTENVFLLDRAFSVLVNLIEKYDQTEDSKMQAMIFSHTFFQACIKHKERYGGVREKLFVRYMKKANYGRFKRLNRYLELLGRVKCALNSLFLEGRQS